MKEKILVTGVAGFIGFHLAKRLLSEGHSIVGVDNINSYYNVSLKYGRLEQMGIGDKSKKRSYLINSEEIEEYHLRSTIHPAVAKTITEESLLEYGALYQSTKHSNYLFVRLALEDYACLKKLFEKEKFHKVVHLAAQAGVRYSIENPWTYLDCNIEGTMSILEACRHNNIGHLVYASSSSVYGLNKKMPLSVSDNVDHPISLYAATKKSNELMAHTYSYLYNLPTTGLRFFTVYGPWGRPDMALFLFTKAILENKPINVFNHGDMWRDFTYIDDIVEGVCRVTFNPPEVPLDQDILKNSSAPCRLYNIGNSTPVKLTDFIIAIERTIGKQAKKNLMKMQPGDVPKTWADTTDLVKNFGYKPGTPIDVGIQKFIKWYRNFYNC